MLSASRRSSGEVNEHPPPMRADEIKHISSWYFYSLGHWRVTIPKWEGHITKRHNIPLPLQMWKQKSLLRGSEALSNQSIKPKGRRTQTRKMPIVNWILSSLAPRASSRKKKKKKGRSHEGLNRNLFSGLKIKLAITLSCLTSLLGTCHIYNA